MSWQRRSENLFEEIHARIRSSFEAANSAALEKFDETGAVPGAAAPDAHGRGNSPAGGRPLAAGCRHDHAAGSRPRHRRRSVCRFVGCALPRKSGHSGTDLERIAQAITGTQPGRIGKQAVDLKHHTLEEMFKSAEWYEKKNANPVAESDGKAGGTVWRTTSGEGRRGFQRVQQRIEPGEPGLCAQTSSNWK